MKKYNNEKAIIALSSWNNRINTAGITISNLLGNCPDFHICLTLSNADMRVNMEHLPLDIKKFIDDDKIEVLWVDKDYGIFSQFIWTMEKYPNVPIITAYDDCIYLYDYASELYTNWCNNKNVIYTSNVKNKSRKLDIIDNAAAIFPPHCFSFNEYTKLLDNNKELYDAKDAKVFNSVLAFKSQIPVEEINAIPQYYHHDDHTAMKYFRKNTLEENIALYSENINKAQKIIGIYDGPAYPDFDPFYQAYGGCETWLQEISKAFSDLNWHVILFTTYKEHMYGYGNNIEYVCIDDFKERCKYQKFDKFIYSREIHDIKYLDCKDINLIIHDQYIEYSLDDLLKLNHIYMLSEWHRDNLIKNNKSIAIVKDKIKLSFNAINNDLYKSVYTKENSMVWSSCRERGFDFFKTKVLPLITAIVPDFKVYIANYSSAYSEDDVSDNIIYLGTLNKQELAEYQLKSKIWCYPNLGHCNGVDGSEWFYGETFCITAIENYMAKNILIVGDQGGLKTTLAGYELQGTELYDENEAIPYDKEGEYAILLANKCIAALTGKWQPDAYIKKYTWRNAALSML